MVDLDASDQEVAAIMGGRPQLEASAGAGTMAAGKEACGGDQSGAIGAENTRSGGCKATKLGTGPSGRPVGMRRRSDQAICILMIWLVGQVAAQESCHNAERGSAVRAMERIRSL